MDVQFLNWKINCTNSVIQTSNFDNITVLSENKFNSGNHTIQ